MKSNDDNDEPHGEAIHSAAGSTQKDSQKEMAFIQDVPMSNFDGIFTSEMMDVTPLGQKSPMSTTSDQ